MKLSIFNTFLSYTYLTSVLVQHVHGMSFVNTPTTRDLHLAAALGLNADSVILDPIAFRQMADSSFSKATIPTQSVDVRTTFPVASRLF